MYDRVFRPRVLPDGACLWHDDAHCVLSTVLSGLHCKCHLPRTEQHHNSSSETVYLSPAKNWTTPQQQQWNSLSVTCQELNNTTTAAVKQSICHLPKTEQHHNSSSETVNNTTTAAVKQSICHLPGTEQHHNSSSETVYLSPARNWTAPQQQQWNSLSVTCQELNDKKCKCNYTIRWTQVNQLTDQWTAINRHLGV